VSFAKLVLAKLSEADGCQVDLPKLSVVGAALSQGVVADCGILN
jgi:hypothetical protein